MPQLLHLQNGDTLLQKISSPAGRLATLLNAKKTDAQIVEELFVATLCRLPRAGELAAIQRTFAEGDSRDMVLRDVFWAVLNSKEFAFNH
jgi:hypothetical protein